MSGIKPKPPKRRHRQPIPADIIGFWDNAIPEPNTGCLLWLRGLDGKGYGVFSHHPQILAHRYAYELAVGPIPDGMKVLHRCDNPPCINPRHMFIGGHSENVIDCVTKGRHARTKINTEIVREIRRMREAGDQLVLIGERFGLTGAAVAKIALRRRWAHVT